MEKYRTIRQFGRHERRRMRKALGLESLVVARSGIRRVMNLIELYRMDMERRIKQVGRRMGFGC